MKTLARGFLVLWLVPTAALARLGDGDASFQAWMRPSPHYASMVIPCFVAAVAISSLMLMRCLHLGRPLSSWRIAALLLNTILTGLVLFVLCPSFLEYPVASFVQDAPYMWADLPPILRPPISAVGKPLAGLILVATWFVLQPSIVQVFECHYLRHIAPKLRVWPSAIFSGIVFLWIVTAMLRLMCIVI